MRYSPFRSYPSVVDFEEAHSVLLSVIAAKRVVRRRNHRLQNCSLRVRLLLDPESPNTEDEDRPEGYDQDESNSVSIIVTIIEHVYNLSLFNQLDNMSMICGPG